MAVEFKFVCNPIEFSSTNLHEKYHLHKHNMKISDSPEKDVDHFANVRNSSGAQSALLIFSEFVK